MITFYLICGNSGSGKSHYGNDLCQKINGHFLDDVNSPEEVTKAVLDGHTNIVLTHPFFCDEKIRQKLLDHIREICPDAPISMIFFENDPQQCRANAKLRDRKVEGTIRRFEKTYRVPPGFIPVPVWRPPNADQI